MHNDFDGNRLPRVEWLSKRSHANVFKQEERNFLKRTSEKQTKPIIPGNNITEHFSKVAYDDSMEISSSNFSFGMLSLHGI